MRSMNENAPIRFVRYLLEKAAWPFRAAAKYRAQWQPAANQRLSPLLLIPAFLLSIPLYLLIFFIAIAYVFFVLPVIYFGQVVARLLQTDPQRPVQYRLRTLVVLTAA